MAHPTEYVPSPDDGRDLRFRPANPDAARTLTAGQVEAFNDRGYLRSLAVFDAADADRIRVYTDELLDAVVNAPDPRNAYSINGYHLVCRGLYDLVVTPRHPRSRAGPDRPRHRVLGNAPLREAARRSDGGAAAPGRGRTGR